MSTDRAAEFIRLYNEIDHFLKDTAESKPSAPFWKRLKESARRNPALKRCMDDLLEFHQLRNAIIHHRAYPEKILAEPSAEVVGLLAQIVEHLYSPPLVIPRFERKIRTFELEDPLAQALNYMRQNSCSQVAVRGMNGLRLLTSSGITRWLAAQIELGESVPGDAVVADALAFDREEALRLLPADATVDYALEVFLSSVHGQKPRLFAIIITNSGDSSETPLGIITPRDLLHE